MNLAPQCCPRCGSPLQTTADGQAGICPQCRTTFTLQLDVKVNNLASLIRSGMEYLRQGDFTNAEEQSRKIIDLDASCGEGWLLKAATTFDIAQADQAFTTGLRQIGETERQAFALLFKPLALSVWKKANSMLVRDAGRPGMSRAARQHYEIKAKAAQLTAFAIELFPLSGWQEELTKYTRIKAWDEYTQAEQVELFDMLTKFDSKASSDLDAFVACRERLVRGLAEHLPEEYAALTMQAEDQATPNVSPVQQDARSSDGSQPQTSSFILKTVLIGGALILLVLWSAARCSRDSDRSQQSATTPDGSKDDNPAVKLVSMTPAQAYEFGFGQIRPQFDQMMATVKDDLYPNSVTNQMRRRGGGTELTPANVAAEMRAACAEIEQDQEVKSELRGKAASIGVSTEVVEAYLKGRLAGVAALSTPLKPASPTNDISRAALAAASSPNGPPSGPSQPAEKSPLGDLIVQRPENDEIWLACTNNSRRPAQLCEHDQRTGQVAFSPDEQWIVVTDGGGPGSSLGTELRPFHRESQNTYHEITDAGIAEKAAEAVLRRRHVPESVELVHVYAQVDGWEDGTKLKFRVWADDGRQPGFRLEPATVTFDVTALQGRQPAVGPVSSQTQDDSPPSSQTRDYSAMQAERDRADAELNDVYKRLMNALNPAQQEELRVGERTWIKARDTQADALARGSTAPGSDYQVTSLRVLTDLTRKRTQALTAMLANIRTASSAGLQKRLPNGAVAGSIRELYDRSPGSRADAKAAVLGVVSGLHGS